MSTRRILIVGGSTRAAADSVRRAGWQPVCADLFADLDLRSFADVIPVRSYPESLPEDVADVHADGWFYCGALENRPDIIERMLGNSTRYGPLLGTSPESLRLVRNPLWLRETLSAAGIPMLDVASSSSPPAFDGSWLQKPLASAGGRSIRIWDRAATYIPFDEPHYFQRRTAGSGFSAMFRFESGTIEWLGASREIATNTGYHSPSPFAYCGSCGPLKALPFRGGTQTSSLARYRLYSRNGPAIRYVNRIDVRGSAVFQTGIQRQLTGIAKTLVKSLPGLRGPIGLDFRLQGANVWLTEVNPRYTASVEILELSTGRSLLNSDPEVRPAGRDSRAGMRHRVVAKQILYAESEFTAPDLSRYLRNDDPWQVPLIADIPFPQAKVEPGWPICTVLAGGATATEVEACLRRRIAEVQAALKS